MARNENQRTINIFCGNCKARVEADVDPSTSEKRCRQCGRTIVPKATQLDPGVVINGFLIENKLGQGGMGVVYKAKQLNLDRFVALKILSDELSKDKEFVERFFREARAAAGLSHPNVVQVYDAGSTADGIYYFAMELVEGETLETRIMRDGILAPKDALNISLKVAQALEYAWDKQKLSHGDIKPENIMLNSSGGVKLADLGLAKSMHDESASRDGLMATPLYAPPEIIAGDIHRIDCRADMYSLGSTLYHMLSGAPPFNDTDPDVVLRRHLNDTPRPLSDVTKEINPSISKLVERLLMKNPEERYDSWKSVVKAIEKVHDSERKVVHKPAAVNIPKVDLGSISTDKLGADEGSAVKKLAVLLGIMLLVLLALYLLKVQVMPSQPGTPGAGAPSKEHMMEEMRKLVHESRFMTDQNAISQLEAFKQKYGPAAPPEIQKLINDRKKGVQGAEDMVPDKAEFQKELASLLETLKSDHSKDSAESLRSLNTRIESVLKRRSDAQGFPVSQEDISFLTDKSVHVTRLIADLEAEAQRKHEQELAKLEQERLDREKKLKEESKARRQQALAENRIVDLYFASLAQYAVLPRQKRDLGVLQASLEELSKAGASARKDISAKIDLLKRLCSKEFHVSFLLGSHSDAFVNKPLPFTMQDFDPQYKVAEINEKWIKLVKSAGDKGKGGVSSVAWKQIPDENVLAMIDGICEKSSGITIQKAEKEAVAGFLLLNGLADKLDAYFDKLGDFSDAEKALWREVRADLASAPRQKECSDQMASLFKSLQEGKDYEASHFLVSILMAGDPAFVERYRLELEGLCSDLRRASPQVEAAEVLKGYQKFMDAKNFSSAVSSVMSAKSRCMGQKDVNEQLKEKLDFLQAQSVSAISESMRSKSLNDMVLPFISWEKEQPGQSLVYWEFMKDSSNPGLAKNPKVVESMLMASSLSSGNWGEARSIMESGKAMGFDEAASKIEALYPWTNSLLFADSLLQARFGPPASRTDRLAGLFAAAGTFKDSPQEADDLYYPCEYALSLRLPEKAAAAIAAYNFAGKNRESELRLALLHILAALSIPEQDNDDIAKLAKKYAQAFRGRKEFSEDVNFMGVLAKILGEEKWISPENVNMFKARKFKAQDLCARIFSELAAKYMLQGSSLHNAGEIAAVLDSVSMGLATEDAWRRACELSISLRNTLPQLQDELQARLADTRICAIGSYPRLKLMEAGLSIAMDPGLKKEAVQADLARALDASTVATDQDKAAAKILLSANPAADIASLASAGSSDTAFWAGMMAALAGGGTKDENDAITEQLLKIRPQITRNQKLMMSKVMQLSVPRESRK